MYTYAYQQPSDYHFSLDSVHFAEFLASYLKDRQHLAAWRVLDLCAGCGVIGFELAWYLREIKFLDFVEVQAIYTPYFQQNLATVNRPELVTNWYLINYENLLDPAWQGKYDLIISNPPYFRPEDSTLSASHFKNRCRFFLDSTFKNFIMAMLNSLAPGGEAYFLMRPLKQHGHDLLSELTQMLSETSHSILEVTQIRGNAVIQLK